MAGHHEGFGPGKDGSDRKNSKKKESNGGSDSVAGNAKVARFLFEKPEDKDAKSYHVYPRERRNLLTGALLSELTTDQKEDNARPKPEQGAETADAGVANLESEERATEAQFAALPEVTQLSDDSAEKSSAKSDENDHDYAPDSAEDSTFFAGWARSPDTEVVVPIGMRGVSGDMYDARAESNKEQPVGDVEPDQPVAESAEAPPVVGWHEQPQLQHQARDYEISAADSEPHATLPGGGSGDIAKAVQPGSPEATVLEESPEPEEDQQSFIPVPVAAEQFRQPEPAEVFREYARRDAGVAHTISSAEQLTTQQEANQQAYYAERAGQHRGLVTGLLVGGTYEHFKHKRREKKAAKAHQEQVRKLQKIQEDQKWAAEGQAQKQAELTRQLQSTETRLTAAETRPQFQSPPSAEAVRMAERQARERPLQQRAPEMQQAGERSPEQIDIPPEHRIESSAWHHIEVDARTGQPVETPVIPYGDAFRREQREIMPLQQRNAAAGEVALVAAAGGGGHGGQSADDTTLPPADIPSATTQGHPDSVRQTPPQPFSAPAPKPSRSATPLWPYLVTLGAILLCLVVLLH